MWIGSRDMIRKDMLRLEPDRVAPPLDELKKRKRRGGKQSKKKEGREDTEEGAEGEAEGGAEEGQGEGDDEEEKQTPLAKRRPQRSTSGAPPRSPASAPSPAAAAGSSADASPPEGPRASSSTAGAAGAGSAVSALAGGVASISSAIVVSAQGAKLVKPKIDRPKPTPKAVATVGKASRSQLSVLLSCPVWLPVLLAPRLSPSAPPLAFPLVGLLTHSLHALSPPPRLHSHSLLAALPLTPRLPSGPGRAGEESRLRQGCRHRHRRQQHGRGHDRRLGARSRAGAHSAFALRDA